MWNKTRNVIDSGIILVGLMIPVASVFNKEITWLFAGG